MLKDGTRRIYQHELKGLNHQYLKQRERITERYLTDVANQELVGGSTDAEHVYGGLPARLGYWQAKHATQVREIYPELAAEVSAIEALAARRAALVAKREAVSNG